MGHSFPKFGMVEAASRREAVMAFIAIFRDYFLAAVGNKFAVGN
jgi:hypothetical protein